MKFYAFAIIVAVVLAVSGCSQDGRLKGGGSSSAGGSVFGNASTDEIFEPYQGEWTLIDRSFDPPVENAAFTGGPDISINGHIIRFGSGLLISELRLCQVRATDEGIECEAWHHEDIHDPGDMSRADCKLHRDGDKLILQWHHVESNDYSDDPVIAAPGYSPPVRQGGANDFPWWIETYSRKSAH